MLKIRKAESGDIPNIVGLWSEFMLLHDKIVLKQNNRLKPYVQRKEDVADNYEKFLQENISSGKGAVFVAKQDDALVGFTLVIIKKEIPIYKIEKIGNVSDLFVKKEFRGKGIASKLRDAGMKWFKEKGLKHASILLYRDNPLAHEVYTKWGFFDYKLEMRKEL